MRCHVNRKQFNAKMCFVCGLDNNSGLKASFYETENNQLVAIFNPNEFHQSYPNRLHGGVITAILDETIGRAIMIDNNQDDWGVTVEFTTRYRKPIPLNEELRAIGRITKNGKRIFEGTGEILLADGSIGAEGHGKYLKIPLDKIAGSAVKEDWKIVQNDNDPVEISI